MLVEGLLAMPEETGPAISEVGLLLELLGDVAFAACRADSAVKHWSLALDMYGRVGAHYFPQLSGYPEFHYQELHFLLVWQRLGEFDDNSTLQLFSEDFLWRVETKVDNATRVPSRGEPVL